MKRALASVALTVVFILSAGLPASAADSDGSVVIHSPGSGDAVKGSVTVEATAQAQGGLLSGDPEFSSFTVKIVPKGKGEGATIPNTASSEKGDVFKGTWDTTKSGYNGSFDVRASATTKPSLLTGSRTLTGTAQGVLVNNPPVAPTGVKAALTGKVPVVTWKANPEPDIKAYRVLRAAASGSFQQVGSVTATKFSDSTAPAGLPLRYQIVAVRSSPVSEQGITAKSGTTDPVTIPAPEPAPGEDAGPNDLPADVFIPETVTAEPEPEVAPPPPPPAAAPLAPIIKSVPLAETNIDFAEQLPFDAEVPERFDSSAGGDAAGSLSATAADDSGSTVSSPIKFMIAGLVLLGLSLFLARLSRKLFKASKVEESKPPPVHFPAFRVGRSH